MQRLFITLLCVLLLGCASSYQGGKSVVAATQIIHRYPSWRNSKTDKGVSKASILTSLQELSSFDPQIIRCALMQITHERAGFDLETAFKLRVVNRFIFNVPEWIDKVDSSHFGGWVGIPEEDGRFNELWPLQWGSNGRLELAGSNFGYMGPGFDAVGEFDWFKTRYGLRTQTR